MCLPLPSVHMCLRCGGRQKLWLTVVMSSILAATQTTGRLHAHLSRLYRWISGTHKGRGRLIVLGVIHLLSRLFMLMFNVVRGNLVPQPLTCGTALYPSMEALLLLKLPPAHIDVHTGIFPDKSLVTLIHWLFFSLLCLFIPDQAVCLCIVTGGTKHTPPFFHIQ